MSPENAAPARNATERAPRSSIPSVPVAPWVGSSRSSTKAIAANTPRVRSWRRRYAAAPSWTAPATSFIASVPVRARSTSLRTLSAIAITTREITTIPPTVARLAADRLVDSGVMRSSARRRGYGVLHRGALRHERAGPGAGTVAGHRAQEYPSRPRPVPAPGVRRLATGLAPAGSGPCGGRLIAALADPPLGEGPLLEQRTDEHLLVLGEVRIHVGVDDRLLLAVVLLQQREQLGAGLLEAVHGRGVVLEVGGQGVHAPPQLAVLAAHHHQRHHQR